MLLEVLMQYSGIISQNLSPLVRRFCNIQIVIITNFVAVSSVSIKRVDCITLAIKSWEKSQVAFVNGKDIRIVSPEATLFAHVNGRPRENFSPLRKHAYSNTYKKISPPKT